MAGFGHRHGIEEDVLALFAQRVAGKGDAQLDGSAQIAGVEFLHLHRLAALHDVEVGESLRLPRV